MKGELVTFLRGSATKQDKVLVTLLSLTGSATTADVRAELASLGLRASKTWNISALLGGRPKYCFLSDGEWVLQAAAYDYIKSIGYEGKANPIKNVVSDLEVLHATLPSSETKKFVKESLDCYKYGLLRSAVVMSWLAAVHALKLEIVENHLTDFNTEARRIHGNKWKRAVNADDLGKMKESDFLNRLEGISVLGGDSKKHLLKCLDLRNSCGHPNSFVLGENTVASHLEILLSNVFSKFC